MDQTSQVNVTISPLVSECKQVDRFDRQIFTTKSTEATQDSKLSHKANWGGLRGFVKFLEFGDDASQRVHRSAVKIDRAVRTHLISFHFFSYYGLVNKKRFFISLLTYPMRPHFNPEIQIEVKDFLIM